MINVIIFGEAGVGKSSVINLIAGREVVEISPDPSGITMASKAYDFTVDNKGIRIWDTVGLEDPQTGFSSLGDFAIKEAHQLISSLSEAGGVRLLLLCTRGDIPRAATMQRNYRLFNEFFCEKKVPIALVITHLEREMYMENWWGRNGRTLEIYGMHNIGHACITGLPGHRHYATSRQEIRKLLMDCALEDSASLLESQNPLAMMGRRIMGLVGVGSNPSRKDIERALKKRCGLDPRIAGEVAELMMASEKQSYTSTREIAVTMLMTPREEDTRSPAPAPFKGPWLKLVKAIRDVDGPGFSPPANQTKFRSSPPLVAPQSNTVEPPLGVNTAEPMQSQASHASGSDSSSLYPSSKLVELPRDVNPGPVDPLQIPHPPSHLLPPPTTVNEGKGIDPSPSPVVIDDNNMNSGVGNPNDIRSNFAPDLTGHVKRDGQGPLASSNFGESPSNPPQGAADRDQRGPLLPQWNLYKDFDTEQPAQQEVMSSADGRSSQVFNTAQSHQVFNTAQSSQEEVVSPAEGDSSPPPSSLPTTIDKGKGKDPRPLALVEGDDDMNSRTAWHLNDIRSNFAHDLTGYVTQESERPFASGSFGDIYRGALRMRGRTINIAMKAIRTYSTDDGGDAKKKKRIRREIKTWLNLDHDNVLPLLGTTMNFGQFPAMVCPWLENGSLTSYLERQYEILTVVERLTLVSDVAAGLQYLHSRSVVHGDLSGGNVLIDADGRACISDFGLSTLLTQLGGSTFATTHQAAGTLRWTAPELLDLQEPVDGVDPPHTVPSPQSDVYSFGRIMLQVLTGKVPYHYYVREARVLHAISKGVNPKFPGQELVTNRQWMFIERCWTPLMADEPRPGGEEIVEFVRQELVDNAKA